MNIRRNPESRVGEKINDWEIIDFLRDSRKFLARCKCGFERKIQISEMKTLNSCQSCKFKEAAEEYVGKTFNKLKVTGVDHIKGKNRLKVKCQCGNEYLIQPHQLKYQRGCCRCKNGFYPGAIIDGMTLLEYLGDRKYKIKCVCGNVFESIPRKYNGKYAKCGCEKRNKILEDCQKHVGEKFDNFVIKRIAGVLEGHVIFELKCKCGNVILRKNGQLYKSKSCGCLDSLSLPKGEKASNAKLKNNDVISMREFYDSGQYDVQTLMDMYNLPYSYVRRIVTRKIWKSI